MAKPIERTYTLPDPLTGEEIAIRVRRDGRLKRTARLEPLSDGSLLLRIPKRLAWEDVPPLLGQILADRAKKAKAARRRTDDDLARRAREINRKYFGGRVRWRAIRWVDNMEKRLGSVSIGGNTDGHIRISSKIRHWPRWVVDYVIAHEFTHLLLPKEGHSAKFWETLQQAYPKTERARGFIRGYFFALGEREETTEDTAL